jgi:hypothetical protein
MFCEAAATKLEPGTGAAKDGEVMTYTPSQGDGPLAVSLENPRHFTHASGPARGRAVYLTGSHIWNNLQDGMGPGPTAPDVPEPMDYAAYLRFLGDRGHNFIRLWRWEQFQSQAAGGNFHLDMSPQPWKRSGAEQAKDGKPRFDLDQLDDAFFERLLERVTTAGGAGMYVGVMLFDGWALHLSPPPDNIEGHPFHAGNNVNGIAASSINDLQVLPLDPRVQAIQEAFIHRVVDTLHDQGNVLWEVANESSGDGTASREMADYLGLAEPPVWGDSTEWQYWVIDVVKRHEAARGYETHPIGMTMQFPVADQTNVNDPLLRSRAEWISPGYDDELFVGGRSPMEPGAAPSRWYVDPPIADGAKVVISDTDHFAAGQGDALWAWKTFVRGNHPILMDYGLIGGLEPAQGSPADTGVPPFEAYEPARWAMGDTRAYAERVDLIAMVPSAEVASTGFALVSLGAEYLVLQPDAGEFTVELPTGRYRTEWFDVTDRETLVGEPTRVESAGPITFAPPFPGHPTVLYLSNVDRQEARA